MPPPNPIDILIYSGPSTSPLSLRQALTTLRALCQPTYAVSPLSAEQLLSEPWAPSCALLVFPGGADLGYCRTLNGAGNSRIREYVRDGGRYLGFCAGGYYGAEECEFEKGKEGMEVVGKRELAFFPGVCRGLAFKGFVYGSEAGARAVEVRPAEGMGEGFRSYYNGGGGFVGAGGMGAEGVEVLADYGGETDVELGGGRAAVVYCRVGEGAAVLTGPHPEFSGALLDRAERSNPDYPALVDALVADDAKRVAFVRAILSKLGLRIGGGDDGGHQDPEPVPSLSPLHLSAAQPSQIADLVTSWREAGLLTRSDGGDEHIRAERDSFHLSFRGADDDASAAAAAAARRRWSVSGLAHAVSDAVADALPPPVASAVSSAVATLSPPPPSDTKTDPSSPPHRSSPPPASDPVPLTLHAHTTSLPSPTSTPSFSHAAYFSHLAYFSSQTPSAHLPPDPPQPALPAAPSPSPLAHSFGNPLLYGEVVSSTSTLLERNPSLLARLPTGSVAVAGTQVAGRGRGANVWVSPRGSLMFSVVMRHPYILNERAPVLFVQYLAAMAVVEGVRGYGEGYEGLEVRLKWPNDVYAREKEGGGGGFVKVGGILVNSSFAGEDYTLVVGVGINVGNEGPTTSLSRLAEAEGLAAFELERLMASVLVRFEGIYAGFRETGFDEGLEGRYYDSWLHTDQVVTLETEGGARARIKGITRDWGMLVAEELGWEDRATGRRWQLLSDHNSFDFFKGLLRRKV